MNYSNEKSVKSCKNLPQALLRIGTLVHWIPSHLLAEDIVPVFEAELVTEHLMKLQNLLQVNTTRFGVLCFCYLKDACEHEPAWTFLLCLLFFHYHAFLRLFWTQRGPQKKLSKVVSAKPLAGFGCNLNRKARRIAYHLGRT